MASADQKKAFISLKLTFLKDQRDHFIDAVSVYIDEIIEAGKTWTEGGDNQMDYLELGQMIDSAVVFLGEKGGELQGASLRVAGNQLSQPSCQQLDLTSGPKAATTSTSATSDRQPPEPVQTVGEPQLKPVLARIALIEEVLCSFQKNTDKAAEQQSGMDQQLKELLCTVSESNNKNNSKLKIVEEHISEIKDKQVALDQEHETRLLSLEKQLQKLSTAQDRMKAEMESQTELTEKLVHVPDQLESVKEKLGVLDARIGRIMDDCSNKHQDIEHVTRDLADKVMANTETVKVISTDQDHTTTLLRELETRMQTLEADSGRNLEDVQKHVEKGETNLRILCQMLNDLLTPLEQLKTCLNKKASTRDENIRQLTQVIQEVAVMSTRLQQLELKSSRTRCGFTARAWLDQHVEGDTVKPYTTLLSNIGGNFDADSGIFTAPVDGLYLAAICVHLQNNETLKVTVKHKRQGLGQSSPTTVCWSIATVKGTQACNVGVVDMKAGGILFAEVYKSTPKFNEHIVYFSCFLVA